MSFFIDLLRIYSVEFRFNNKIPIKPIATNFADVKPSIGNFQELIFDVSIKHLHHFFKLT